MNPEDALRFVESHGVVLASAKGPVPRMSEVIAGESIRGSWWGHPKGAEIYAALGALQESPDVLVCRVVGHLARSRSSSTSTLARAHLCRPPVPTGALSHDRAAPQPIGTT